MKNLHVFKVLLDERKPVVVFAENPTQAARCAINACGAMDILRVGVEALAPASAVLVTGSNPIVLDPKR